MADRWRAAEVRLREGTHALLTNRFEAAEAIFVEGSKELPPSDELRATDSLAGRDTRGAFALHYAVVGALRGIGSLANDQVTERPELNDSSS